MEIRNITIIGAGNGGYAAAADLLMKGFHVTIYELPEFNHNLFPMIESGRIKVTGEIQGIVDIPHIEVDLEKAVHGADIILVITHTASHKQLAHMLSSVIEDDQLIMLIPGYTGGALCFEEIFRKNGVSKKYRLAEANTLPYACRKITGESAVHIKLYVKKFQVAAFPASETAEVVSLFQKLYPNCTAAGNVLETGFNNGNPVLNVVPIIFNAGRIEYARGEYYHFQEGVTPSVARVMEALDEERLKVGQAFQLNALPYLERVIETGYVKTNSDWYTMIATSPHLTAKGPESLHDRYLTEDVPYGLSPWYHMARHLNLEVTLITSFIHLASALMGVNYFEKGRTLADMGIDGMSVSELHRYLAHGTR